jgi:hypothetical protein
VREARAAGARPYRGRSTLSALSGPRDAEEAFDAAKTDVVSGCELAGGGSGAVGTHHGSDHVVGESLAKAPRYRGGQFGPWPPLPCDPENANVQVSGLHGVRVSGKYLH